MRALVCIGINDCTLQMLANTGSITREGAKKNGKRKRQRETRAHTLQGAPDCCGEDHVVSEGHQGHVTDGRDEKPVLDSKEPVRELSFWADERVRGISSARAGEGWKPFGALGWEWGVGMGGGGGGGGGARGGAKKVEDIKTQKKQTKVKMGI